MAKNQQIDLLLVGLQKNVLFDLRLWVLLHSSNYTGNSSTKIHSGIPQKPRVDQYKVRCIPIRI